MGAKRDRRLAREAARRDSGEASTIVAVHVEVAEPTTEPTPGPLEKLDLDVLLAIAGAASLEESKIMAMPKRVPARRAIGHAATAAREGR